MTKRQEIFKKIEYELIKAYDKHGRELWGRHEFYGVLKEEVDEAWDAIKADAAGFLLEQELIQVAAMVVRFLETGDRDNPEPSEDPGRAWRMHGGLRGPWGGA